MDQYSTDENTDITNADLETVAALAERQLKLENRIVEAEDVLKKLKAAHRKIAEDDLPTEMAALGLLNFTLANGKGISIKQIWNASIAGVKKDAVIAWLRSNDHDDIVSSIISVTFGKGENEQVFELLGNLADAGFAPREDTTVNTATFKALCKELVEDGIEVPLNDLGVYVINKATIK